MNKVTVDDDNVLVIGPRKRVVPIEKSHDILKTGRYLDLGYDKRNIYFVEK